MRRWKIAAPLAALVLAAALYLAGGNPSLPNRQQAGNPEVVPAPPELRIPEKEGIVPRGFIKGEVIKVIDGDTVDVSYKNKRYKVRLLCIDTPESNKRGVPVQPYAKEASEYTSRQVLHKTVTLVFDRGLKDKYDRLLAYVLFGRNGFLNAMLVKNGYARAEILKPNNSLEKYFYSLQEDAIKGKRGCWGLQEGKRPFVRGSGGTYVPGYWLDRDAS